MKYTVNDWAFSELLELYNKEKLNLNPPYQRNDIWSTPAKKRLIDTIVKGMPLPAFFLHKKDSDSYDMVDGQQRTRTILGYKKGLFKNLENNLFTQTNHNEIINNYRIAVIILEEVSDDESVADFYYRVNKFGSRLNRPEIIKAEYFDTPLQDLVEQIADDQRFKSLSLFTEATISRMADYDFIAELLTLIEYGITDKKIRVDRFYERVTEEAFDLEDLGNKFYQVLDEFKRFNSIYPISNTRYKQRNDFYTYFGFISSLLESEEFEIDSVVLDFQYNFLVRIGKDISPSSECYPFQEYAHNCVSQSNSKNARTSRLALFNSILLNKVQKPIQTDDEEKETDDLIDIINYYKLSLNDLIKVGDFYLIDYNKINS